MLPLKRIWQRQSVPMTRGLKFLYENIKPGGLKRSLPEPRCIASVARTPPTNFGCSNRLLGAPPVARKIVNFRVQPLKMCLSTGTPTTPSDPGAPGTPGSPGATGTPGGTQATEITAKDKLLAKEAWALVQRDAAGCGIKMFRELFTAHPDYVKYFEGMKTFPDENILDSPKFKKHVETVLIPAVTKLLHNIDHPDKLAKQVKSIGINHKQRGLHREEFKVLQEAIITTFKKNLPEQFTQEVETAWNNILAVAFDEVSKFLESK